MLANKFKPLEETSFDELLDDLIASLPPAKNNIGCSSTPFIKALQFKYNELIGELNDAADKLDTQSERINNSTTKNLELHIANKALIDKQQKAEALAAKLTQALKQAQNELKLSQAALEKAKKEEKRNKAQIARLKESATKKTATPKESLLSKARKMNDKETIDKLVKAANDMRRELMAYKQSETAVNKPSYVAPLHSLYSKNNCHIVLIDNPQNINVDNAGKYIFQYTLLYAHSCGTYYTFCLSNADVNNPEFLISSGVFGDGDNENLEQYEVQIPKNIERAMEQWLVKVNIVQDCVLEESDYCIDLKK